MKQEKKHMVQRRSRKHFGLIIDKPQQGGGYANDGNTAGFC